MSYVQCHHCGGSGKEFASTCWTTDEVEYRTCNVCEGTGSIDVRTKYFTIYPDLSLRNAFELIVQHERKPVRICIAGNHDIRVKFKKGNWYILGGFTVGYRGTGPDYTERFLNAAGFSVSIDEIAEMQPPVTLIARQPYISQTTLLVQGSTVEEAKKKTRELIPEDAKITAFVLIRDCKSQTIEGEGNSKEEAIKDINRQLPPGVLIHIQQERVVNNSEQSMLTVHAYSEQEARSVTQKQLPESGVIQKIICTQPMSKGFLGFGRKQGIYEVFWLLPWRVALTYQPTAAVRVMFQPSSK